MRGFLQAEHGELDALNHILAGTDLHHDKQERYQKIPSHLVAKLVSR